MLNHHVTWLESGARSDGPTEKEPGIYPASENEAAHAVAPGTFVQEFCSRLTGPAFPDDPVDAVRVWVRNQGLRPAF